MDMRGLLMGVGIGAGMAFILDPDRGGRRRAVARDKVVRGAHRASRAFSATACDISNRARGMVAATRGRLTPRAVDDDVLVERVRAKLGRATSHPHAIDAFARNGTVTLRGPILADEMKRLISTAARVRGVRSVVDELEPHRTDDGIPSLQGGGRVGQPALDVLQSNWAPATRALVGATAVAAAGAALAYVRR